MSASVRLVHRPKQSVHRLRWSIVWGPSYVAGNMRPIVWGPTYAIVWSSSYVLGRMRRVVCTRVLRRYKVASADWPQLQKKMLERMSNHDFDEDTCADSILVLTQAESAQNGGVQGKRWTLSASFTRRCSPGRTLHLKIQEKTRIKKKTIIEHFKSHH